MREICRENERLAHALDGEQPTSRIVFSVCEKDFGRDTRTDGSDKMENVVLGRRRIRERRASSEEGKLLGSRFGVATCSKV